MTAPHPAPAAPSDGKALQRLIEVAVSHAADMTRAAHVVAAHPFNMAATAREFDLAAAELLAAVKAVQAEFGLVGVTMEPLSEPEDAIPAGWVFSTADFSMRAREGAARLGRVSLIRDVANRRAWLDLPETEREATPLFVGGVGPTLRAAILDAAAVACAVPGEPT